MKIAAILSLLLVTALSLYAAPLKGSFMLTADSVEPTTKNISVAKGRASLVSDHFRVSADEIVVDQSALTTRHASVLICRGVTSVSSGYTIPASRELTVEIDGQANIYVTNSSGVIVTPAATSVAPAQHFSAKLPRLDLRLHASNAAK